MTEKRLYHSVADQIMKLIKDGAFPPGTRLPGERELAERFNVSRVTVREAEIALQALGFISIKTGSGVYVLDPAEKANSGAAECHRVRTHGSPADVRIRGGGTCCAAHQRRDPGTPERTGRDHVER